MKMKSIVLSLILLISLSFLSLGVLNAGGSVEIKSKGKAWAKSEGNVVSYGCDNSDEVTCTITIILPDN
jgi:hypothetical protein